MICTLDVVFAGSPFLFVNHIMIKTDATLLYECQQHVSNKSRQRAGRNGFGIPVHPTQSENHAQWSAPEPAANRRGWEDAIM